VHDLCSSQAEHTHIAASKSMKPSIKSSFALDFIDFELLVMISLLRVCLLKMSTADPLRRRIGCTAVNINNNIKLPKLLPI